MKVIFLDIDGVLNTINTFKMRKEIYNQYGLVIPRIDLYRIEFLKRIINETEAKIVISSIWSKCEKDMKELLYALKLFDLEIYGVTSIDKKGIRSNEIIDFLNKHNVDSFVILDDESSDLLGLEEYLVKTRENFIATGLLEKHVNEAINILNKSKKLVLNIKDIKE